jgi:hypothetical protein
MSCETWCSHECHCHEELPTTNTHISFHRETPVPGRRASGIPVKSLYSLGPTESLSQQNSMSVCLQENELNDLFPYLVQEAMVSGVWVDTGALSCPARSVQQAEPCLWETQNEYLLMIQCFSIGPLCFWIKNFRVWQNVYCKIKLKSYVKKIKSWVNKLRRLSNFNFSFCVIFHNHTFLWIIHIFMHLNFT